MAVTICPWCQSEVPHEEGQEPDKYCPICDNELDGYRTLRVQVGQDEEELDEHVEDEEAPDDEFDWGDDRTFRQKNEELLLVEETVEGLLDEQELVPECPQCREYMLEAGEQVVPAEQFRPRVPEKLGKAVLEAPFKLTVYVCPACFATQTMLSEADRNEVARRLSEAESKRQG